MLLYEKVEVLREEVEELLRLFFDFFGIVVFFIERYEVI